MDVELDINERVGILWLKRERTNGLNSDFLTEITTTLRKIESMDSIGVVVIASKLAFGFSSGLDLASFYAPGNVARTAENVYRAVEQVYQINRMILSSKKIYLVALSGPVIGSAVSMVLSCDLRVSDERTWFWLPDPQYGGLQVEGGIELLCKLVGISRAKILLLSNDRINAKTAHEWGLIYTMLPSESFDEALRLGLRLSNYSPLTLASTKKIINSHILWDFQEEMLSAVVNSAETFNRLQSYFHAHDHRSRSFSPPQTSMPQP